MSFCITSHQNQKQLFLQDEAEEAAIRANLPEYIQTLRARLAAVKERRERRQRRARTAGSVRQSEVARRNLTRVALSVAEDAVRDADFGADEADWDAYGAARDDASDDERDEIEQIETDLLKWYALVH